jgi:hypothetical protein
MYADELEKSASRDPGKKIEEPGLSNNIVVNCSESDWDIPRTIEVELRY